jgi:hypothetical protein
MSNPCTTRWPTAATARAAAGPACSSKTRITSSSADAWSRTGSFWNTLSAPPPLLLLLELLLAVEAASFAGTLAVSVLLAASPMRSMRPLIPATSGDAENSCGYRYVLW